MIDTRSTSNGRHATETLNLLYWEVLWNLLHRHGWHLVHYSWTSPDTGGVRHCISARKGETWFKQSKPTITEALEAVRTLALGNDGNNSHRHYPEN